MLHVVVWRKNMPTVVTYLREHELDAVTFEDLSSALCYLFERKGF